MFQELEYKLEMRILAVCMRPWHKQQIFRDASNSSRFQHSTFCEHPNFGATKKWSSRIWNDQQIGIYGLQVSRIWHGNSHTFIDGLPIKNGDLHIHSQCSWTSDPQTPPGARSLGMIHSTGRVVQNNPVENTKGNGSELGALKLGLSLHTHTHTYIYIHRHIKLMRHGRFSGQHDFRSPWYQIHMTIHDHTWPCHHGKEQPPRRWKAPGFWFSDVSSVWKAPTGSPRNFRQVKVKTPWNFQEFERLQMGFSENRAARNSNGLPSFSLLKKIAYFYGYPIYFQTNPNSTNGIVWCGNRPNLWVPAFE